MSKKIDEEILKAFLEGKKIGEIELVKTDFDVTSACLGGVPTITCSNCGHTDRASLHWQPFDNGTTHIRAACSVCSFYSQYMTQIEQMRGLP